MSDTSLIVSLSIGGNIYSRYFGKVFFGKIGPLAAKLWASGQHCSIFRKEWLRQCLQSLGHDPVLSPDVNRLRSASQADVIEGPTSRSQTSNILIVKLANDTLEELVKKREKT